MKVSELINILNNIEDKDKDVIVKIDVYTELSSGEIVDVKDYDNVMIILD